MTDIEGEAPRELIRSGGNSRYFYLPAYNEVFPESYINFRRMSTVSPECLTADNRITSLSTETLHRLLMKMFLFFTGSTPERINEVFGLRP